MTLKSEIVKLPDGTEVHVIRDKDISSPKKDVCHVQFILKNHSKNHKKTFQKQKGE